MAFRALQTLGDGIVVVVGIGVCHGGIISPRGGYGRENLTGDKESVGLNLILSMPTENTTARMFVGGYRHSLLGPELRFMTGASR